MEGVKKGITGFQIADFILRFRLWIMIFITLTTGYFAYEALTMKVGFDFNNLLPTEHPYVRVYKEVRELFGGANVITIMVARLVPIGGITIRFFSTTLPILMELRT